MSGDLRLTTMIWNLEFWMFRTDDILEHLFGKPYHTKLKQRLKTEIIQTRFDVKTGYLISRVRDLHAEGATSMLAWPIVNYASLGQSWQNRPLVSWYQGYVLSLQVHWHKNCGLFYPYINLHKVVCFTHWLLGNSCLNDSGNITLIKRYKGSSKGRFQSQLRGVNLANIEPNSFPSTTAFLEGTHRVHICSDDGCAAPHLRRQLDFSSDIDSDFTYGSVKYP